MTLDNGITSKLLNRTVALTTIVAILAGGAAYVLRDSQASRETLRAELYDALKAQDARIESIKLDADQFRTLISQLVLDFRKESDQKSHDVMMLIMEVALKKDNLAEGHPRREGPNNEIQSQTRAGVQQAESGTLFYRDNSEGNALGSEEKDQRKNGAGRSKKTDP